MVLGRQETVRSLDFGVPVVCEAIAGNSSSLKDSSSLG